MNHYSSTAAIIAVLILVTFSPLHAEDISRAPLEPPGIGEILLVTGVSTAALMMRLFGHTGNVAPSEDPGTIDYRIDKYFPSRTNKALAITADVFNWGAPLSFAAYLGCSIFIRKNEGRTFWEITLVRFWEGYAATSFLTQLTKISVRRPRPDGSDDASFFSGHASSGFYCASFITGYVGDELSAGALRDSGTFTRITLGYVLPGTVLYGLAGVSAFARIRNHKHYFTDVLTGSLVGTATGCLTYWLFTPRRSMDRGTVTFNMAPQPGGMLTGATLRF